MKTKLYPYQEKIVESEKHKKSHNLSMDMGTGKTVTSLALFEKNPTHKILVICLISKCQDWQDDLEKELNIKSIILNKGSNKNNILVQENHNAYIINFESAWRCEELLKWVDNDTTVLIDESHKIKSHTSKIGKFCQKLKKCTQYKMILSGTMQSVGYVDYYNQLYFTDTLNMSYKQFSDRYCVYDIMKFNGFPFKQLVGYRNTKELESIIHNNCVFFERDVDNDLIPSDIDVHIEQPKIYPKFKKVRVYEDYAADNSSKLFVTLRTICSGFIQDYNIDDSKIVWLKEFLEDLNDRVVIFYNFNGERDRIIALLEQLKIPYSEYNGREKDLTKFQKNKNGVAVCQYISASTGLNDLVASHICVFYSPTTSYTNWAQSRKRIDRIGQTVKPLYYNLCCRGTVEEKIVRALKDGKDFDDKMFDAYMKESE
jgi:SNF2 family DNA or RNA helicase